MRARHAVLIGITALSLSAPALSAQTIILPPDEAGVVEAVRYETARAGWPHVSTPTERLAVAQEALAVMTVPERSRAKASCSWPTVKMGTATCRGTVYQYRKPTKVMYRWKISMRIFEDGSYRIKSIKP